MKWSFIPACSWALITTCATRRKDSYSLTAFAAKAPVFGSVLKMTSNRLEYFMQSKICGYKFFSFIRVSAVWSYLMLTCVSRICCCFHEIISVIRVTDAFVIPAVNDTLFR